MAVNRKSRNANFLQNGSPKKRILDQITSKVKTKPAFKKKTKQPKLTLDQLQNRSTASEEYFKELEEIKKIKMEKRKSKFLVMKELWRSKKKNKNI